MCVSVQGQLACADIPQFLESQQLFASGRRSRRGLLLASGNGKTASFNHHSTIIIALMSGMLRGRAEMKGHHSFCTSLFVYKVMWASEE